MRKVLFIFVDGLGIAPENPETNPISERVCPTLIAAFRDHAASIDAALGVPGLPQSATGQTTLLTGINAQKAIGRHVEGFPGPALREIIRKYSIFEQLKQQGLPSTFANGYLAHTVEELNAYRVKSVTTVATLAAFGDVRRAHALKARDAVSHDLTRKALVSRGYSGEHISPEDAAADLVNIAKQNVFTLFEFFQTDRVGHACDMEKAKTVLTKLNRFVTAVLKEAENENILVILTSDHGNIEDLSVRTHTNNPVPFMAIGPGDVEIRKSVSGLDDITPELLQYLG
jgi:2,3-bisphosphoglycerate-independent phosphoglycerate mutase